MEYLLTIVVVIIFLYVVYKTTTEKENKENEKIRQEWKLINELKSNYKKMTEKELEKELRTLQNDYKNLIDNAHKEFKKDYPTEEVYDELYGFDKSYEYAKSLDYMLYMKYTTIKDVLDEGDYATDLSSSDYIVVGELKEKTKDEKFKTVIYTAKIKFDVDDGERLGFVYNRKIKKCGEMAVLLYCYIKKINVENDNIIFTVRKSDFMMEYIKNHICYNIKEIDDSIVFKLKSEKAKELKKEINLRRKDK